MRTHLTYTHIVPIAKRATTGKLAAQDLFSDAIKAAFGPALRSAGLRGSGRSYYVPSRTHFAFLGFQKSQSSNSGAVKFTVNLKVVSIATWQEMRRTRPDFPLRPAPSIRYGSFEWNKRIGDLLPGGEDKWWQMRAGQTNSATIAEVVEVLMNIAVPAMRMQFEPAGG